MPFNSKEKNIIRSNWSKPLLKYLTEHLGKKLFYVGLPSPEALDIKEWIDYLDVVYAFQCRDYPHPSEETQSRDKIIELEKVLSTYERQNRLATFEVYDGYIEEVILKGRDNSSTPKTFSHSDVVTVYNLDYCNAITSPMNYIDEKGNRVTAFKFDAIRKLVEMQRGLDIKPKKFILFLTLHSHYQPDEVNEFLEYPPDGDTKAHLDALNEHKKAKKGHYLVRAYVINNLKTYFLNNGFVPEFLPTFIYKGDGNTKLLHFTVIGTEQKGAGVPPTHQRMSSYLLKKFVGLSQSEQFTNLDFVLKNETNWSTLNPVKIFKDSTTFKKLWQ
jgi:hypothetical protein